MKKMKTLQVMEKIKKTAVQTGTKMIKIEAQMLMIINHLEIHKILN
jgi:hypothetical protein